MSDHWCEMCHGEKTFAECCAEHVERVHARNAEPELLRTEVERLRAENRHLKELSIATGAENAELRLRTADAEAGTERCVQDMEALKSRLAWFVDFEAAVERANSFDDVDHWLRDHPKPK